MTTRYEGSCHCGAVRFSYEGEEITRGVRCNCSLCSRRGAMMTSEVIPPERFVIDADDGALGLYQFGDRTAKHYFCKHCGIYPFHVTVRKAGHYRANLACIEGVDPFELEAEVFDGRHLL
jgi:hypothetical protein